MAVAPLCSSRLQSMLKATVQSVQWTYSIFWQLCPQQEILVWEDGHYNGAIKTRKTVQTMEVGGDEEGTLQRSKQLRELYESLSVVETNTHTRCSFAALSPEDLTESEWFYLMCVSFSFAPGEGLPGKAYAKRQHIWLVGADEVDNKTFSRAILAKSAHIQTVVCIPVSDGVVELGTTDKVQEDLNFIEHIKTFFTDVHNFHHHPPPPKLALSEHSTSNPASSSDHFHAVMYTAADPTTTNILKHDGINVDDDEDECETETEDERGYNTHQTLNAKMAEPSELMQVEMAEDIRIGSSNDGSNNLDSDFHFIAVTQTGYPSSISDSVPTQGSLQPPSVIPLLPLEDMTQEDTHYSQTLSNILQNQYTCWVESPSISYNTYSTFQSAFTNCNIFPNHHHHLLPKAALDGTSQRLLKCILFTAPYLHAKNHVEKYSPQTLDTATDSGGDLAAQIRGKGIPQDEHSTTHVLAERRRREKLNERFIILKSLVPFVTKMDKASILGDTIEYVKLLRRRIQDLEARNLQILEKEEQRSKNTDIIEMQRACTSSSTKEQQRSGVTVMVGTNKRKVRIVERNDEEALTSVQVSIIESDALLELECPHREGLLLDVIQKLRELRIEVIGMKSSLNNGVLVAELRAKVKGNVKGKKVCIVEVKTALSQIIPQTIQ
ncbi:PREDICTED: basic helix-loop-helix protein A-like isoform X1 [Lupinus angustifolius]|uniref:basic helix-loop-helix protein A-like isoform X1 n=1 Tax=Lupinus angustifolius TaxID=3871 RepID=UPI00092F22BB|nr:PREDICTED: basic helix-loop-helix protein A-like isoform X1 [Lupinus angustifolius]